MTTLYSGDAGRIGRTDRERILGYYDLGAPLMARLFAGTPLVYASFPRGLESYSVWHGTLRREPRERLPIVDVPSVHGVQSYIAFSEAAVKWLAEHASAVEFHGWGCTVADPVRARFARILLELDREHHISLAEGALVLRGLLSQARLQAIVLLQGRRALALWIPLSGGPRYPAVRAWLHDFCARAAAAHPNLFSLEPNTVVSGRVHLHVSSNALGRYSGLPYSLRGDSALLVCAPVTWDEVQEVREGDVTAEKFPIRLGAVGELFGDEADRIGEQSLAPFDATPEADSKPSHGKRIQPHGHILLAAATVLQDGRPRDAETILAEALARHLVAAGTKKKYVYSALLEYIVRTSGRGHKPIIVQDVDRRFRINEPEDDWPPVVLPAAPPVDRSTKALIDRLVATVRGPDPRAFEIAVCDALAHLGFVATHVGGHDNPDGYADAPLGVLGYRAMLECKTGTTVVHDADAVEASKYKDPYGADVCAIVGSAYTQSIELSNELQTHGVAAFTADDLQQLLRVGSNPSEMRPLFEPGFASDRVGDLLWERLHGASKRVGLICDYLCDGGWVAQVGFAKGERHGGVAEAPSLTLDAAMLLVDQRLRDDGAKAVCGRGDVEAAFAYLTSPRVAAATWTDDRHDAIVVVSPMVSSPT